VLCMRSLPVSLLYFVALVRTIKRRGLSGLRLVNSCMCLQYLHHRYRHGLTFFNVFLNDAKNSLWAARVRNDYAYLTVSIPSRYPSVLDNLHRWPASMVCVSNL